MKKNQLEDILEKLLQEENLKRDSQGTLYMYDTKKGVWEAKADLAARTCIRSWALDKKLIFVVADVRDIICELRERIEFEVVELNEKLNSEFIVCRNGRLNLRTGELKGFYKEGYDKIALDFSYIQDANLSKAPATHKFLQECLGTKAINTEENPKLRRLFQMIGYCLSNLPNLKKAIILLGPPNTGKSVLLKLMCKMMPPEQWRSLLLHDITDKFRVGELDGAHLVVCHETNIAPLRRLDIVKSVISGDPITIEKKGIQPWRYTPNVKLIMAANSLPTLGEVDAGGAFADRLLIQSFAKRSGNNDPDLLNKLYNERDIFFSVVFKEMQNFLQNGCHFTEDEDSKHLLDEYRCQGNTVISFLHDLYEKTDGACRARLMYDDYKAYCRNNLYISCTKTDFRQQLTQLGYKLGKRRLIKGTNPVSCVLGLSRKLSQDINQKTADCEGLNAEQCPPPALGGGIDKMNEVIINGND